MTDTSKMRSEFESFCREVQGWEDDDFRLASDGVNYYWGTTSEAWIFWQASRQAVVVELPPICTPYGDEYAAKVHDAIEAAGLRCEVKS